MQKHWRFVLGVWGIALFAALTYHAVRFNREMHPGRSSRYFWWGGDRLDSDPLNRRPSTTGRTQPCAQGTANCIEWEPDSIWVDSGLMEKALVLTAIPAFLVGLAIVRGFARFGISEVTTFMAAMPVCITLWFYSVGWLLDRWRYRRRVRLESNQSITSNG
jgi:hypothetical protein